jgi:probable ribonuclease FAU-1
VTLFPVGSPVRLEHGKPWKGAITMNGVARSYRDGLLVVERTFTAGGRYDSLGDEKRDGDHGIVEIVPGGWVLRRAYYRADGHLIGELFNIQTPVELRRGVVRYTDLEVDVVRRRDGSVEVVDEDDLRRTVLIGGISPDLAETALVIAHRLADILREGGDWRTADADFRTT